MVVVAACSKHQKNHRRPLLGTTNERHRRDFYHLHHGGTGNRGSLDYPASSASRMYAQQEARAALEQKSAGRNKRRKDGEISPDMGGQFIALGLCPSTASAKRGSLR